MSIRRHLQGLSGLCTGWANPGAALSTHLGARSSRSTIHALGCMHPPSRCSLEPGLSAVTVG
jgi:hypothetical protein